MRSWDEKGQDTAGVGNVGPLREMGGIFQLYACLPLTVPPVQSETEGFKNPRGGRAREESRAPTVLC